MLPRNETVSEENTVNRRSQLANAVGETGGEIGRLEASESGGGGTERPGSPGMGGERSQNRGPFLLGAELGGKVADGARALVRMLRTCHVGAVLTKRLVFAALLASRARHVAGSEPGLGQVNLLLMTSAVFLSWLVIAKPYVSRVLQGIELGTGFLEVFTLSLALLSGRAERKAFRSGTAGSGSLTEAERRLSAAMLGLQIVAVGLQTGYQWWAAILGLRAHWKVWKERRESWNALSRQVWRSRETVRNGEKQSKVTKGSLRERRDLRFVLRGKERRGAIRERAGRKLKEEVSGEEAPERSRGDAGAGAAPRVSQARRRNKQRLVTSPRSNKEIAIGNDRSHGASEVEPALTLWLQEDLESKSGILSGVDRAQRNGSTPSIESIRGEAALGMSVGQSQTGRTAEERESASQGARAARDERKGQGRSGKAERKQGRTEGGVDRGADGSPGNHSASSGGGRKAISRKGLQRLERQRESRQMVPPDRAQHLDCQTKSRQTMRLDEGEARKDTRLLPHSGGQELVSRPQIEEIIESSMRASVPERKSARAPRLGRLKSRRKVTATAVMTYFVVSESDESEASDGEDRTAGVNVHLASRRNMVASFTFETEPKSVDRSRYEYRVA